MITGGASEMDEQVGSNLARLFTQGIAPIAISRSAMIIDGGTQAGVMKIIGRGNERTTAKVNSTGSFCRG